VSVVAMPRRLEAGFRAPGLGARNSGEDGAWGVAATRTGEVVSEDGALGRLPDVWEAL